MEGHVEIENPWTPSSKDDAMIMEQKSSRHHWRPTNALLTVIGMVFCDCRFGIMAESEVIVRVSVMFAGATTSFFKNDFVIRSLPVRATDALSRVTDERFDFDDRIVARASFVRSERSCFVSFVSCLRLVRVGDPINKVLEIFWMATMTKQKKKQQRQRKQCYTNRDHETSTSFLCTSSDTNFVNDSLSPTG